MAMTEKEINCMLFDQLSILERIEAVAKEPAVLEQIKIERNQIKRKLYQLPLY